MEWFAIPEVLIEPPWVDFLVTIFYGVKKVYGTDNPKLQEWGNKISALEYLLVFQCQLRGLVLL